MAGNTQVNNVDSNRLYITGVPRDLTDDTFNDYLSKINCPTPLFRARLHRGQSKNGNECLYAYTFLEYDNPDDSKVAMHLLHLQRPYLLKVVFARRREYNNQQRKTKMIETETCSANTITKKELWHSKLVGSVTKLTELLNETTFSDFLENSSKKSDSGVSEKSGESSRDHESMSCFSSTSSKSNENFDLPDKDSIGEEDQRTVTAQPNWYRDIPLTFMEFVSTGELVRLLPTANSVCGTCTESPFVDHIHYIIDEQTIINPIESMPPLKNGCCEQCGNNSKTAYQFCSGCQQVMYCSNTCQVLHWKRHVNECSIQRR